MQTDVPILVACSVNNGRAIRKVAFNLQGAGGGSSQELWVGKLLTQRNRKDVSLELSAKTDTT